MLFGCNFSDTKSSIASSNKDFSPQMETKVNKLFNNIVSFCWPGWEGDTGKHFPYGLVPQRLRAGVRGHPVRACTPHNLHSQAKTIKRAPAVAPLPAIGYSHRGRAWQRKLGKEKSQLHDFYFSRKVNILLTHVRN